MGDSPKARDHDTTSLISHSLYGVTSPIINGAFSQNFGECWSSAHYIEDPNVSRPLHAAQTRTTSSPLPPTLQPHTRARQLPGLTPSPASHVPAARHIIQHQQLLETSCNPWAMRSARRNVASTTPIHPNQSLV